MWEIAPGLLRCVAMQPFTLRVPWAKSVTYVRGLFTALAAVGVHLYKSSLKSSVSCTFKVTSWDAWVTLAVPLYVLDYLGISHLLLSYRFWSCRSNLNSSTKTIPHNFKSIAASWSAGAVCSHTPLWLWILFICQRTSIAYKHVLLFILSGAWNWRSQGSFQVNLALAAHFSWVTPYSRILTHLCSHNNLYNAQFLSGLCCWSIHFYFDDWQVRHGFRYGGSWGRRLR